MLFRRIKTHVEKENWFAVFVDFLIVVVGVFIGIQVANWNDARGDKVAFNLAMKRLEAELSITSNVLQNYNDSYGARMKRVQAALVDIRNCTATDEAIERINMALNLTSSFSYQDFPRDALTQLVTQDRFRDLQAPKLRDDLTTAASHLKGEIRFLKNIYGLLDGIDFAHPYVEYSDLIQPESDREIGAPVTHNFESRRLRLAVRPEVACKDPSFAERLYRWERAAQYTRSRNNGIIESIPQILKDVGLELKTIPDQIVDSDSSEDESD